MHTLAIHSDSEKEAKSNKWICGSTRVQSSNTDTLPSKGTTVACYEEGSMGALNWAEPNERKKRKLIKQ